MPNGPWCLSEDHARQGPTATSARGRRKRGPRPINPTEGRTIMTAATYEIQPPVTELEIQMLRLYYDALDDDRKQQLLDYSQQLLNYAQQLIEEQGAERDSKATT